VTCHKTNVDQDRRKQTIFFVHLRLFVYLRLMSWKHLQSLFQIHSINYLTSVVQRRVIRNPTARPLQEWPPALIFTYSFMEDS